MLLSQALDAVLKFTPKEFAALSDLLSPELIDECLADKGVVTIRKRRLPMEMMVWAVAGNERQRTQSSSVSPGTRANSRTLFVTSTAPVAMACPAIAVSFGSIGVPASRNAT